MITLRDVVVAVVVAGATLAAVALAQTAATPAMSSSAWDWNSLKVVPQPYGARRDVFLARTPMLDRLDCHITTLNPGEAPHAAKPHDGEELIIIKEGTIDALQDGKTNRLGAGSILFELPNEVQGMRNVGDTPATYFVIRWFAPGTLKTTN
ncbi:MAG: cupin domain-containing protein [Verrucomicrobiia bacterium]|jgi:mannose-6-phosphate isomerase-like protein (cupin superfamily)